MASIRILKKTINHSLSLFIDDCYAKRNMKGENSVSEIEKLVDKAIILFDDLIEMVNSKDETSNKYKAVEEKLDAGITQLYNSLDKIS